MELKKTLTSIVLAGALAIGGLTNKAKGAYFEDFNDPNCINEWVISDSNVVYPTTFEDDGVLGFDFSTYVTHGIPAAHINIKPLNNKPFKLEWDSYLESRNTKFRFGLFCTTNPEYGYIFSENVSNTIDFTKMFKHWNASAGGRGYGGTTPNFFDKWFHNVLLYNFPYENGRVNGLITYEGKGSKDLKLSEIFRDIPSSEDFSNLDKLGFSYNPQGCLFGMGNRCTGYIDNVLYTEIEEHYPLLKGDINKDGIVDFKDFSEFANDWLKQEGWY